MAYRLGPRLNAAGRLAHARQGVELLLTEDPAEAREMAYALEALNSERQAVADATQQAVLGALEARPELVRDRPAIVVDGEGWEAGVLGLVAGALAERYSRPAIVIRRGADGVAGGSARSVEGVDIRAAIMSQESLLLGGGGHPMAAGFSISNEHVEAFRHGLWAWLEEHVPERPPAAPLLVDAVVPWAALDLELARALDRLAPHGAGNPEPVLASLNGRLVRDEDVSSQHETPHRRLYIGDEGGRLVRVLWFQAGELPMPEQRIDVAYQPSVNRYRGQESLQLTLVDWRPAGDERAIDIAGGAAMVAGGREVVDLRSDLAAADALASLRARHGDDLAVWAEATVEPLAGALGRHALTPGAPYLAVAGAPPDGETLRQVVARVDPSRVYLLPPKAARSWEARELLPQVAGMVRWALGHEDGRLDLERMAAQVGLTTGAVLAALRALEAGGAVRLERGAEGWRAVAGDGEAAEVSQRGRALHALERHLRETAAFRESYPDLPVEALLAGR